MSSKCFTKHILGSTAFSQSELAKITAEVTNQTKKHPERSDAGNEAFALEVYLKELATEEFKITSGFNLRSPEGTPTQEKTNVADHVKQGIPTFLNTGVDLFKFIVNSEVKEISARFAKFVNKNKLDTNEEAAIKNFQSFINKYINGTIDKPGFFNNTGIEGVKEPERATALLNADLFRQLTYMTKPVGGKRVTTEAVKAALGYASYKALADLESTTHFKTQDEMERIHGSAPAVPFNQAQQALVGIP
jgi:hypothetical protein